MTERDVRPTTEDWEKAATELRTEADCNIARATGVGGRHIRKYWLDLRMAVGIMEAEARRIAAESHAEDGEQ